jgi:hypothetical protein
VGRLGQQPTVAADGKLTLFCRFRSPVTPDLTTTRLNGHAPPRAVCNSVRYLTEQGVALRVVRLIPLNQRVRY